MVSMNLNGNDPAETFDGQRGVDDIERTAVGIGFSRSTVLLVNFQGMNSYILAYCPSDGMISFSAYASAETRAGVLDTMSVAGWRESSRRMAQVPALPRSIQSRSPSAIMRS